MPNPELVESAARSCNWLTLGEVRTALILKNLMLFLHRYDRVYGRGGGKLRVVKKQTNKQANKQTWKRWTFVLSVWNLLTELSHKNDSSGIENDGSFVSHSLWEFRSGDKPPNTISIVSRDALPSLHVRFPGTCINGDWKRSRVPDEAYNKSGNPMRRSSVQESCEFRFFRIT